MKELWGQLTGCLMEFGLAGAWGWRQSMQSAGDTGMCQDKTNRIRRGRTWSNFYQKDLSTHGVRDGLELEQLRFGWVRMILKESKWHMVRSWIKTVEVFLELFFRFYRCVCVGSIGEKHIGLYIDDLFKSLIATVTYTDFNDLQLLRRFGGNRVFGSISYREPWEVEEHVSTGIRIVFSKEKLIVALKSDGWWC